MCTVGEGVTVPAVLRIFDVSKAIGTRGKLGQNRGRGAAAGIAFDDRKERPLAECAGGLFESVYARRARRSRRYRTNERCYFRIWTLRLEQNALRVVEHPTT